MRVRDYVQATQTDMGTSGTIVFDLDYSDPITEIDLLFEAVNGSSGNKDNPIALNITRIEITDGGEVLWSLPGEVAFAYFSHLQNRELHQWYSGALNGNPWVHIPLRFGRFLYDQELAFNPVAHRNPQLRITFDEATIRAAGATGYVSDSFTCTVLVKLMEDVNPPVGFLSSKEIEQYASLGSGDKKTELPTDRVIRSFFVRAWITSVHLGSIITNHKLSLDGGKFVPFDLPYRSMRAKMTSYFTPLTMASYTVHTNNEYRQSWIGDAFSVVGVSQTACYIVACDSHGGGRVRIFFEDHDGSAVTGAALRLQVRGLPLFQTLIYPFGRLNDPSSWFDPRAVGKLDYFATQGSAGADVNVCLEQLHPY